MATPNRNLKKLYIVENQMLSFKVFILLPTLLNYSPLTPIYTTYLRYLQTHCGAIEAYAI